MGAAAAGAAGMPYRPGRLPGSDASLVCAYQSADSDTMKAGATDPERWAGPWKHEHC